MLIYYEAVVHMVCYVKRNMAKDEIPFTILSFTIIIFLEDLFFWADQSDINFKQIKIVIHCIGTQKNYAPLNIHASQTIHYLFYMAKNTHSYLQTVSKLN